MNRNNQAHFGLLVMRASLGVMFILHGYPMLLSGPPAWERLGSTMSLIGIDFMPLLWGLLAGLIQVLGGAMLILGLLTPYSCFSLAFVMTIATAFHLNKGDSFSELTHPLELGLIMMSLILIGPGRFSIDHWLFPKSEKREEEDTEPPEQGFILGSH